MRELLSRPTMKAAAALVIAAVITFVVWRLFDIDGLDAWMPNIVTGLLTVAVTITVVERIIEHDAQRRAAPRMKRIHEDIREQLELMGYIVLQEHAETHPASYTPPASPLVVDVLNRWLADAEGVENLPTPGWSICRAADRLSIEMETIRVKGQDFLDPAFQQALDDCAREIRLQSATSWVGLHFTSDLARRNTYGTASAGVIRTLAEFIPIFETRIGHRVRIDERLFDHAGQGDSLEKVRGTGY